MPRCKEVITMTNHATRFALCVLSLLLLFPACSDDDGSPTDTGANTVMAGRVLGWAPMTTNTPELLWGVWGGKDDVVAVGTRGSANHLSGDEWLVKPSGVGVSLCDVWMSPDGDALAVGPEGTILRYDGTWSAMNSGTSADLNDVFGFSDGRAFAVGAGGTVLALNNG